MQWSAFFFDSENLYSASATKPLVKITQQRVVTEKDPVVPSKVNYLVLLQALEKDFEWNTYKIPCMKAVKMSIICAQFCGGAKTRNEQPRRFFLWLRNSSFFSLFLCISSFFFLYPLTPYSIIEKIIVGLVVGPLMFVLDRRGGSGYISVQKSVLFFLCIQN